MTDSEISPSFTLVLLRKLPVKGEGLPNPFGGGGEWSVAINHTINISIFISWFLLCSFNLKETHIIITSISHKYPFLDHVLGFASQIPPLPRPPFLFAFWVSYTPLRPQLKRFFHPYVQHKTCPARCKKVFKV